MSQYINLPPLAGLTHKKALRSFMLVGAMLTSISCLAEIKKSEPQKVESQKIVVPSPNLGMGEQNRYINALLKLALEKTEPTYGSFSIEAYPEVFSLERHMLDLKNNTNIDVIWTGVNAQRLNDYRAVKIPLLKELNEYRVFLIRKEDKARFAKVKTLDDLRQFTAGSSPDWPSTHVLIKNQIPVVTVKNASLLFPMLKAKRFDYISRNLYEVWSEQQLLEDMDFIIEPHLLLHDGVQLYLFFSKQDEKLADRVETGLQMALADGSFEKLFLQSYGAKQGRAEIQSGRRLLLQLTNNESINNQ